jgi:alpha-glucosidase
MTPDCRLKAMREDRGTPLKLQGWRSADDGALLLDLGAAAARISIAEDGSVQLAASAGGGPAPADHDAALGRAPRRPVPAKPREGDGGRLWISHEGPQGAARVEVEANPFGVRVLERSGGLVAHLDGLGFDAAGGARISWAARPGERFFGFGERSGGLDKRGERVRMRNRDSELRSGGPRYVSIPFFLGLLHQDPAPRARGVMLDAFGPSRFDVAASREDRVVIETEADGIDLTIFPGPTPAEVLRRFTGLVGRQPLPPLWALGHHQSRWSYGSAAEVRALAREIRARRIPTDVIHLDIEHLDGYRVFTWHPKRFPEPERLVAELAAQGFRVVSIVDPGVKWDEGYPVYRSGRERDAFCRGADGAPFSLVVWPGRAALPDFNDPGVRAWWGEQHRGLLETGVAGIWNDMNEPAGWSRALRVGRLVVPLRGQDLSGMVQRDPADREQRVSHERVRNLYGYQHCRATREFLEKERPGRRPFVLTRSGYTGVQRFAAVWTGDNLSRWSHLRESIPMLLNLSLSGVPFCGADIGGFMFSCTPELYARWIQLGALQPFARTHSMWLKRRQEPWRFGARVEAIARAALELRMRLLPYLYGLFHEAEASGAPVWRPLFFAFPDDPGSAQVEDQVMVGPSLLVAPVVERGARQRDVYLPPGRWYAWHDGARYVGPRHLRVPAPLERLPLFVPAGSVLPMQSAVRHVGEAPLEPCVLHVFPGDDGATALIEDDGESTAYREGAVARTGLRLWSRSGGRLRLELGRREGVYQPPPRTVRVVVHGCPPPHGVHLDGRRLEPGDELPGWQHRESRLHLRFADRGEGHALEVEPAP